MWQEEWKGRRERPWRDLEGTGGPSEVSQSQKDEDCYDPTYKRSPRSQKHRDKYRAAVARGGEDSFNFAR